MLIQSDEGEAAPADPSQWLYSVTKREPRHCDFLVDSGAATPVCQRKPGRLPGRKTQSLEWNADRPRDVSSRRLATQRFARALAHGINVAKDFQSAPKDTGLQRSVTSVGQVRDRGNIITFTSTGGTILNEFTCNRIEFERSDGVYRWRADTSAWTKSGCR